MYSKRGVKVCMSEPSLPEIFKELCQLIQSLVSHVMVAQLIAMPEVKYSTHHMEPCSPNTGEEAR